MNSSSEPNRDQRLSVLLWTATAMVLCFLALSHLGVMVCFLTTHAVLPWVVPIALLLALWIGDWLGQREGLQGRERLWPLGLSLGLTIFSVLIAAQFYDLSWDGQWYHQAAVYRIVQGWNPLTEPLVDLPGHNVQWIRHYAKGPWYGAVAMKALTGYHEAGKFAPWLAMAATLMAVSASALNTGMRRQRAFALGTIIALNPVVISEIISFLVDGLMVCYLACYAAALLSVIRRSNRLVLFVGVAAALCSINSKFTGLFFLCLIAAGVGVYCLVKRRKCLLPLIAWHLVALVLGIVIWGYNPYITNSIHRNHPFYPLLGSKEYPSMAAQGNDFLELYETPPNMMGRPRLVRLAYAVFGRPSFAPYNNQREAEFMWPFAARIRDLDVYRFHDTRIAGLGPWFSGVLVLSLFLAGWLLCTTPNVRLLLLLSYGVIVSSLLLSKHLWWARFCPQLWWLPLFPISIIWLTKPSGLRSWLAWILVGILLINTLMVAAVRLPWEFKSSHMLHQQLVDLRDKGRPIEICMGYFNVSVGNRLRDWGIEYEEVRPMGTENSHEMMSVARGNPGAIRYRFKETTTP